MSGVRSFWSAGGDDVGLLHERRDEDSLRNGRRRYRSSRYLLSRTMMSRLHESRSSTRSEPLEDLKQLPCLRLRAGFSASIMHHSSVQCRIETARRRYSLCIARLCCCLRIPLHSAGVHFPFRVDDRVLKRVCFPTYLDVDG